jgi:hypothetical protein
MRSTANIFNLPLFYQYKVGSGGFGVWREVAAQMMASNWVLSGQCKNFPLVYHTRILYEDQNTNIASQQDIDEAVYYWNDSSAVRNRLESIHHATASVVLVLESIPQALDQFLTKKLAQGQEDFEQAVAMIASNLESTTSFMIDHGMIHFDAHGGNILTDGYRLYFTDFGLATSSQFNLSDEEKEFFNLHKNHDKIVSRALFVADLLEVLSFSDDDVMQLLQSYERGSRVITYSPFITTLLKKYAASALCYYAFENKLRNESKLTVYPADDIAKIDVRFTKNKGK